MTTKRMKPKCSSCGKTFGAKRARAGYKLCMSCGDTQALQNLRRIPIVPMHKGHYFPAFDRADLHGINNKGGLVR